MAMPWPRNLAAPPAAGHIAIDGKTLKGSRRLDAKALHVLSAFATGVSAVIGDRGRFKSCDRIPQRARLELSALPNACRRANCNRNRAPL
jgi:hypothetical protein